MDNLKNYKKKYIKYKLKYLMNQIHYDDINNFPIKAITVFNGEISGTVKFEEINGNTNNVVKILVNLSGFKPNSIHGFHVHESGDLTKGCDSMCAHFNPTNKTHGGLNDKIRHVGDLGNITADSSGNVIYEFMDYIIKLRDNKANIIGRSLVIHEDIDDCGKGSHPTSNITGNSGKRIGCAIIGYASKC